MFVKSVVESAEALKYAARRNLRGRRGMIDMSASLLACCSIVASSHQFDQDRRNRRDTRGLSDLPASER